MARFREHHATTAQMRALFPLMPYTGPQVPGALVGRLLNGTPFTFDQFEAAGMDPPLIHGLSEIVMGDIGYWKSAGEKEMILRKVPWGRSFAVFDYKDEYRGVAAHLGMPTFDFSQLRINPVDPDRLNPVQRSAMLSLIIQLARGELRSLPGTQTQILQAALRTAASDGRIPQIRTVFDALMDPDDEAAAATRIPRHQVFAEGRELAATLSNFLDDGTLGGPFDGLTSPQLTKPPQVSLFNFNSTEAAMRPLIISVVAGFLDAAWQSGDRAWLFDHMIFEECWEYFRYLDFGRMARKLLKLQRVHGAAQTFVVHRLSDMLSAGDAGSEQVALARGLLADSAIWKIYRQRPQDRDALRELCGLNSIELDTVCNLLEPGQALWRLGGLSFVVQQFATSAERQLIYTNKAVDDKAAGAGDRLVTARSGF